MQSLAYITLDLQDVNAAVVVGAKQNDRLSRSITAQLRDGGVAWVPGSGVAATIRYRKPDGTAGFYDTLEDSSSAYSINGSAITFTLAEQMLTVPGEIPVEINFYSGAGEKLTTFIFLLRVQASVLSDAEIISEDYINVLTSMIAAAEAAADRVEAVAGNLPVPSDSAPRALAPSPSAGVSPQYSRADHVHPLPTIPGASDADPAALAAAASPGSSAAYSRGDHVHPLPSPSDIGLGLVDFSALATFPKGQPGHFQANALGGLAVISYQGPAGSYSTDDTLVTLPAAYALPASIDRVYAAATLGADSTDIVYISGDTISVSALGSTTAGRLYFQLIYPIQ